VARVAADLGEELLLFTEHGSHRARVRGRLYHDARDRRDLPAVGDWVWYTHAENQTPIVVGIFDRTTCVVREAAGKRAEVQVVAVNVDLVLVVTSPNLDFNPRRLERYLSVIHTSGAAAAVVMTKSDLCDDRAPYEQALAGIGDRTPVFWASAMTDDGTDALLELLGPDQTIALVGSSGVGKSTLANRLLGASRQVTREVRERDDRGRHTTTHRELFVLPGHRGLLLDTPGMRELGAWFDADADAGVADAFEDITELAAACRFRDCTHAEEPSCAVQAALVRGELSAERLASYRKLLTEEAANRDRQSAALAARVAGERRASTRARTREPHTKKIKK